MQQRSIFQNNTVLSASITVQFAEIILDAFSLLEGLGHGEDLASVTGLTDSHS